MHNMKTVHIEFEFDREGSPEVKVVGEIVSALDRSPELLDDLRARFGAALDDMDNLFGAPLISCTTVADKVIMRLEPSVGLSDLLSAVRALERRDDVITAG